MKNTQKQGLVESLTTLRNSPIEEDFLIFQELLVKEAKTLGLEIVVELLKLEDFSSRYYKTNFLVRLKRQLKGFKIIDYI